MNKLGRLAAVALALMFATFSLHAQQKSDKRETTYKGYLVDKMCGVV